MRRGVALAVLAVLGVGVGLVAGGCGGGPRTPSERSRATVGTVVSGHDAALSSGDAAAWAAFFAPDAFVFGTDPVESLAGRAAIEREMARDVKRMRGHGVTWRVVPGRREIGVSPDGGAAWVVDEVTLVISQRGVEMDRVGLRRTSLVVRRERAWRVAAAHWSHVIDEEVTRERLGSWEELPPVRSVAEDVAPGAQPLVDAAGQALRGLAYAGATHAGWRGGVRAALAPGGAAGWVAAVADFHHEEDGSDLPVRVLLVFARRGGAWEVVATHLSAGLLDVEPGEEGYLEAVSDPEVHERCGRAVAHVVDVAGTWFGSRDYLMEACVLDPWPTRRIACISAASTQDAISACMDEEEAGP